MRELRGIGRGIESRLRELVETGEIAELEELEREVSPDLVGLGRHLGIGARRAVQIARALGVRTASELREAAAAGRLREVPGIGPQTESKLLAALRSTEAATSAAPAGYARWRSRQTTAPRPPRGMLIHRARRLLAEIAEPLDGVPAGDPRRYRDTSEPSRSWSRRTRPGRYWTPSSRCRRSSRCSTVQPFRGIGGAPPGGDRERRGVRTASRSRACRSSWWSPRRPRSAPSSFGRPARASTSPRSSRSRMRPTRRASTATWGSRSARRSYQRLAKREQTKRVEEALRNPYVSCLSHPKGRYVNRRPENELDVDRLIEVALEEEVRTGGERASGPARPARRLDFLGGRRALRRRAS